MSISIYHACLCASATCCLILEITFKDIETSSFRSDLCVVGKFPLSTCLLSELVVTEYRLTICVSNGFLICVLYLVQYGFMGVLTSLHQSFVQLLPKFTVTKQTILLVLS